MRNKLPLETLHLFSVLDRKLIELLKSLSEEEWTSQTVAKRWKVKDVASHLLDGNLRGLSTSRDNFFGEKPDTIHTYQDLVAYLNELNLAWTTATKRLSPQVLVQLLELTGRAYTAHLKRLDPFENAVFSVAWAGQATSPNWFHIAREYTEKFLHQQQIRDAVGKQGIMTRTLFFPFVDTMMYALPHTFRNVSAETGTVVSMEVSTAIGGIWNIVKTDTGWSLDKTRILNPTSKVVIDPDTAWKLFSKSWNPDQVTALVTLSGDLTLANQALNLVGVMA